MKNLCYITFLLNLLFLSSCKDEDSNLYSEGPEAFTIYMAVTNNEGKDLAVPINNYETTGDYPQMYKFDAWSAYLGNKLIQSNKEQGHVIIQFFRRRFYG